MSQYGFTKRPSTSDWEADQKKRRERIELVYPKAANKVLNIVTDFLNVTEGEDRYKLEPSHWQEEFFHGSDRMYNQPYVCFCWKIMTNTYGHHFNIALDFRERMVIYIEGSGPKNYFDDYRKLCETLCCELGCPVEVWESRLANDGTYKHVYTVSREFDPSIYSYLPRTLDLPINGIIDNIHLGERRTEVIDGERQDGMPIHFRLVVNGLKDRFVEVSAYFSFENGHPMKDTDSKYKDSTGRVAVSKRAKSTFDSCEWSNFTLFMPYEQLHITSKGVHDCKLVINVWYFDAYGTQLLVASSWHHFTYTVRK
ncbi:MAG: hypothetical protein WCW14_04520 [Candidatus Paceibacterota bacterium]